MFDINAKTSSDVSLQQTNFADKIVNRHGIVTQREIEHSKATIKEKKHVFQNAWAF